MNPALGILLLGGLGLGFYLARDTKLSPTTPGGSGPGQLPPAGDTPPSGTGSPSASEPEPEAPAPQPEVPGPAPETPSPEPPSGPDGAWVAEHMAELPTPVQDINLSGNEEFKYNGKFSAAGVKFQKWTIRHSLNDLDIVVIKISDDSWIAYFEIPATEQDPNPKFNVWGIRGKNQQNRDFLSSTFVGKPAGSFLQNTHE